MLSVPVRSRVRACSDRRSVLGQVAENLGLVLFGHSYSSRFDPHLGPLPFSREASKVQKKRVAFCDSLVSFNEKTSGMDDEVFSFFRCYRACTHIGRDYMLPPYIVKGIMKNATNLGQLHLKIAICNNRT